MARWIGNYEIVCELGRGGMGVVYKAREESLNRFVAIKLLTDHFVDDETVVERFMREARAVADLNHPNLVQVFRVDRHAAGDDRIDGAGDKPADSDSPRPYFVMEYVEGDSLADLIAREKQMQPMRALRILAEVAAGLAAAHDKGVIHRDIKPENIMLTRYGGVKVVDFGIARLDDSQTRLTTTGLGLGTPSYLSPEVCLSEDVDRRSDIFSLGVVLFEMLAGEIPFKSTSPFELMTQVVEAKIPEIRTLNPNVDDPLKQILARMIAKRPNGRYQHCNELISDIEDYKAGRPPRYANSTPVAIDVADHNGTRAAGRDHDSAGREDDRSERPTVAVEASAAEPRTQQSSDAESSSKRAPSQSATEPYINRKTGSKARVLGLVAALLVVLAGAAGAWLWLAPPEPTLGARVDRLYAQVFGGDATEQDAKSDGAIETAASGNESPANPDQNDRSEDQVVTEDAAQSSSAMKYAVIESTPADAAGESTVPSEKPGSTPETSPRQEDNDAATVPAGNTSQNKEKAPAANVENTSGNASAPSSEAVVSPSEATTETPKASAPETDRAAQPAAHRPSPVASPAPPRVLVMVIGDPLVAGPIQQQFEGVLADGAVDLADPELVGGLQYAESLSDAVGAARAAGVDLLVHVDVVKLAERELSYAGRTDFQRKASVRVRVINVARQRNLGPIVESKLEYAKANAEKNARRTAGPMAREVVERIAGWGRPE